MVQVYNLKENMMRGDCKTDRSIESIMTTFGVVWSLLIFTIGAKNRPIIAPPAHLALATQTEVEKI